MKDFFKRIGRGIKKVGKKIGDFFESKVGKILGGIMLAVALPQIFSSFFSSTTVTGAGATKQATLIGKGGESALVAKGSAAKGTLATAETIKDVQGAVNLGSRFKAAAKQMGEVFTSPIDATRRTLDFMTGGRIGTRGVGAGDLTVAENWRGTSFAKPEMSANIKEFKVSMKGQTSEFVPEAMNFTPEQIAQADSYLPDMGFELRTQPVDSGLPPYGDTGLQEQWVNKRTGIPLDQDKLTAHRFEKLYTTRTKEQFLQNNKFREWYDKTTGLYPDSETYDPLSAQLGLKPSGAYRGVSEYASISDAAAGGPLAQVSHAVNKSWGELTGYTGALSETSVAKTTYGGVTTAQAMFGKQEEFRPPSYNPAAMDQVARNLEVGSQLITSRQADNFYEPLRNATIASAPSIIKKAHQNAGIGYAYGAYAPFNNYADNVIGT